MPNGYETAEQIRRLLKARVPLIVVRTSESTRGLDLIFAVAGEFRSMSFHAHSRAKGLYEVGSMMPVSDDRSFVGALDFATSTFAARSHANFVFSDVDELDADSGTARHMAEMVRLAEERQGSLIVLSSGPVWSGLARLGMTVTLDLPDVDELSQVVDAIVEDHRAVMAVEWHHDEIRRAAEILVGVTQTEAINALTSLLAKGSLMRDDVEELSQFKDQIFGDLNGIERIQLRENDYQVGGLTKLREWLQIREALIKADLTNSPLRPPRGVLLVGVPGCGKSLSAKAIAHQWRMPLYRLDMASILGMYVGMSENRFAEALAAADRVAPCVLWVDEIEKALASGSGDSGTSRRLIGQFLFWLQESHSKVFLVATANDVTSLPPELLRKGRFDELFFVDLPDAEDRRDILTLYFRKYLSMDPSPYLLDELVGVSEGFAGSDLDAAVHEIATSAFITGAQPTEALIIQVFANVVPFSRTNPEEVELIRAWGRDRALPAGRPRDDLNHEPGRGPGRRVIVFN
ncbi:AAA family ATPase [Gordonia sp. NB41Y]|uniref:AAA family ATPase n=1 Tax=Gordonia sp. NB41Y TaxID=875808 RepID=UPI0002BDCFAB|nr:AAA family ATPase [Gordonia sp. NB41Y]EMP14648.1 ATPase [Gordonia sp. NB41Y]WLP92148.1 AAA family ATPase [Gordonia sp. NB41Y]